MALTEEELDMMINWDTSSLGLFEEQPHETAMNHSDSSSSGQSGFQHHEPTAIQTPPLQTQIPGTSSRTPTQASLTDEFLEGLQQRAHMISITRAMGGVVYDPFPIHTRLLTEADFEQPHGTAMNNSDSSSSGQSGFQHHEPSAIQTLPLQTQIPGTSSRAPTQASLTGGLLEGLQRRAHMISITRSMGGVVYDPLPPIHTLTEADFPGFKEEKISKYLKSITHNNNIDDEKTVCAICLDNFCGKDMQVAIVDGCGHKFHACCLKRWLQRKNICPLCRRIAISV